MANDGMISFEKEVEEVRSIVDKLPRLGNGKRTGVSDELRARIVDLWQRSEITGDEFAKAVGFSFSAISNWQTMRKSRPTRGSRFKRMRVRAAAMKTEATASETAVIVEGPAGLKFSMNPSELANLLRRLAC